MKVQSYAEQWQWIQNDATLDELIARYPQEWERVDAELFGIYSTGDMGELQKYIKRASHHSTLALGSVRKNPGCSKAWQTAVPGMVRNRLISLAIKNRLLKISTGVSHGKVRFNYFNGYIAQKLLFAYDLKRKPVSLFWFRIIWPLLWQKRFLMPLVQPKGIYCFYSRRLIAELAHLMREKACLEIAAGDGTLTEFLTEAGVNIVATDNYSRGHAIAYPDRVIKMDAQAALKQYQPEVVICSWPPADNPFEEAIFNTASVKLYIVIGSLHQHASGNWREYLAQSGFTMTTSPHLSRLVLPPELDNAVYLFSRK